MSLIKKEEAVLVAIDFQTKLMPAMADADALEETAVKLIKGIRILDIPVLVTQQYTKGLGPTTEKIGDALGDYKPIEKITFGAMGTPDFVDALEKTGKKSVILIGIEAHICVQQTALQLLDAGYQTYVIQDCIASRKDTDRMCSQQRMAAAGAIITSYEAILYELMRGAKAEGFKAISAIVK